jgi:hypothetical protein
MHSFVIGIILILVAFGIVLYWAFRIGYLADQDADTNLCRVTLAAQDLTKIGFEGLHRDSPMATACKRRYSIIDDTGIYRVPIERGGVFGKPLKQPVYRTEDGKIQKTTDYSFEKQTSTRNAGSAGIGNRDANEEILASYFAESLRNCWMRGLEGKVPVFNDRGFQLVKSEVCMLCEETHIALTAKPITSGAWLSSYLNAREIPSQKGFTYGQYLLNLEKGTTGTIRNRITTFIWALNPFSSASYDYTLSAQATCLEKLRIETDPLLIDGTYATVFIRHFSKIDQGCMVTAVLPIGRVRKLCDYIAN